MKSNITKSETMVVAFVNTEDDPVQVRRTGLFTFDRSFDGTICIRELCEVLYMHPETDMATVSTYQFLPVDYSDAQVPLFEQSCQAMAALGTICELHGVKKS